MVYRRLKRMGRSCRHAAVLAAECYGGVFVGIDELRAHVEQALLLRCAPSPPQFFEIYISRMGQKNSALLYDYRVACRTSFKVRSFVL